MATLEIRRKTNKVWQHVSSDLGTYIVSKMYCKTNGDIFKIVEHGGSQRGEYDFSDITIYDDVNSGSAETFASAELLMKRLEALNYVGFYYDGEVLPANLISTDASNNIILGTDGNLFSSGGGGGSTDWSDLTNFASLTDATTPLAGTEEIAIVQGGVTKKVAVSDLSGGGEVLFTFKNIEDLKNAETLDSSAVYKTSGYYSINDNGGSSYTYEPLSLDTPDDFSVIEPVGGVGRFLLIYSNSLNIKSSGVIGDGVADDFINIQKCIDFVALNNGGSIILNQEKYLISESIRLKQYVKLTSDLGKQVYLPTKRPEISGKIGFAAGTPLIYLGDGSANRRGMEVNGIVLAGNGYVDYGIEFSDTIQNEIKNNLFLTIKTGGAALRGGGALYLNIEKNSFSTGDFYALDSQKNYSYNPPAHYYGINVGNFSKNIVVSSYGVRHEGILDIYENDFEGAIKQRSCIDINSATANSYTNIFNNYFEISQSFSPLTAIRCTSNSGVIYGNRIFGQAGLVSSVAIDIGSNINYQISVYGNTITRWGTGIKSYSSAAGHGDNIILYEIGTNYYNTVTTRISNATNTNTTNTVVSVGDYKHSAQFINNSNHHSFQNAVSFGSCSVLYSISNSLNLVKGNIFKISDTSAVTISSITNKIKGFVFTIYASTGGVVTLPNSQFNLASGQNLILPAYRPILFEVDYDGIIREVGITSSLITDGTAPVDAITPVGYIDIQGKKIPYFN